MMCAILHPQTNWHKKKTKMAQSGHKTGTDRRCLKVIRGLIDRAWHKRKQVESIRMQTVIASGTGIQNLVTKCLQQYENCLSQSKLIIFIDYSVAGAVKVGFYIVCL